MSDILIAPATVEPISLQTVKDQLRVTSTTEDTFLTRLIAVARSHVEKVTGRALVLQSRRVYLDKFPLPWLTNSKRLCDFDISIFRAPVRAVQSVKYLDTSGATQTLATDQYRLDKVGVPARLVPGYNTIWPVTYYNQPNAVWVDYTAGYLIPFTADATTDTLSASGHGFSDGDISQVQTSGVLPTGLSASTNYYAVSSTADTLKLSATSGGSAVDITGAGTAPNFLGSLPADIVHAMCLLIGHWMENREASVIGMVPADLQFAVDDLLSPYRITRI